MVQTFADLMAIRAYNPDQPRDEDGKWSATGGGSSGGGSRPLLHVSDHQLAHHIAQAIHAPELNGEHLHALIHEVAARGKQFNAGERGALRLGAAEPAFKVDRSGDSVEKLTKTAHGAYARMTDAATKSGQTGDVAHAGNIAVAAHSEAIRRDTALSQPVISPKIAPPAGETTIYGKGFTPGQINETQLHHRLQRELDNAHPNPTVVNDVVKELARRGKAIGLDGKLTNTAAVLQDSQAGPKSLAQQVVGHLQVIASPSGYDTKLMKYNRAGLLGNAHVAAIKKGLNIDAHGTVVGNIDFARRKPATPDSPIGVGKNLSQLNDGQLANRLNHELGGDTKPNLPRVNDLMRELANRGKVIDVMEIGSKVKLASLHEDAIKNAALFNSAGLGARIKTNLNQLAHNVNAHATLGIKQNAAELVAFHAVAKERGLFVDHAGRVVVNRSRDVGQKKTFDPGKLGDDGLQAVYDVAHNGLNGVYDPKVLNKIVQAAAARGKVFVANKLRPISEAHLPDVLHVPTSVLAQDVKRAHDLIQKQASKGGFPDAPREILQVHMNAAHVEALKRGLSIGPDGTVHRLGAGTQLQRQVDAAQRPDTAKPATFSKNDLSKLGGNELQKEFNDVAFGKPTGKYTTAVANRVNALHQEAARRNQLFQNGDLIAATTPVKQTSYLSRWIAEDVVDGHRGIKGVLESSRGKLGFDEKQNIANYHAMIGRAHLQARAHNIKIDATGQIEKLPEPPPPAPEPPSHPNALKNLSATHLAQRFGKAAYGNVEGKINLGLVNRLHQEAANRGLKFDSQGMLSKVSAHPEIAALHDSTLAQRIVEANQALKGANHDAAIIDAAHGKLGELHAEAANRGLKISAAGKIDASARSVGDTAEMKQVNFHHVDLSTLHDAPITDLKSLDPGGHVNGAYAGKLHMADGSLVKVVVKPYADLYDDEDQLRKGIPMKGDLAREESASIVNEAMGKPIIMGMATQRTVPGKGKSAVIQFVPGKMPFEVYSAPPESEQRAAAMFDFVIGNKDRHSGNYVMMADNNGEYHLGLFDHGLSFPLQHSDHASEQGNTNFMSRMRGERLTAKETKALQRFLDGYPKAYERMIHAGLEPDAASGAKARAQWLLDNNRLPYSWSDVPGDGDGPSSSSTSW